MQSGPFPFIGPIKNDAIKTHVIESIEESETNFVSKNTIKNTPSSIKKQYGEKASKTPVVDATPLPPLNDAKIGKI